MTLENTASTSINLRLATTPAKTDVNAPAAPVKIKIDQVSFFYGGFQALTNINLEVPTRKIVAKFYWTGWIFTHLELM
jgi:ABC-type multidrug transport system fused ATPase/permease subunit